MKVESPWHSTMACMAHGPWSMSSTTWSSTSIFRGPSTPPVHTMLGAPSVHRTAGNAYNTNPLVHLNWSCFLAVENLLYCSFIRRKIQINSNEFEFEYDLINSNLNLNHSNFSVQRMGKDKKAGNHPPTRGSRRCRRRPPTRRPPHLLQLQTMDDGRPWPWQSAAAIAYHRSNEDSISIIMRRNAATITAAAMAMILTMHVEAFSVGYPPARTMADARLTATRTCDGIDIATTTTTHQQPLWLRRRNNLSTLTMTSISEESESSTNSSSDRKTVKRRKTGVSGDKLRESTGIRPSIHPTVINCISEALLLRSRNILGEILLPGEWDVLFFCFFRLLTHTSTSFFLHLLLC